MSDTQRFGEEKKDKKRFGEEMEVNKEQVPEIAGFAVVRERKEEKVNKEQPKRLYSQEL
jgi:hypothetical protein